MTDFLLYLLNEPPSTHENIAHHEHQELLSEPIRRLIQVIALCWITYSGVLLIADEWAVQQQPERQGLPIMYYGGQVILALIILVLTHWSQAQQRLKHMILPFIILCFSALPLIMVAVILPSTTTGPISGTQGLLDSRLYPLILIGLLLVAWHYSWKHTMVYIILMTGLLFALSFRNKLSQPIMITVSMFMLFTMITFGYIVSTLITGLRRQQEQLLQTNQRVSEANQQLQLYALTREHLTVSRERNRMARELHDTLAHALSGIIVHLETVKAYWEVNPDAAYQLIDVALTNTRSGLNETRRALTALRASPVEDLGLELALRGLLETTAAAAQIQTTIHIDAELPQLSPELEHAIYRIAQEAITNTIDHAVAQTLNLYLHVQPERISLIIQDDGQGFDTSQTVEAGHFGLLGIRERAAFLGGTCQITSTSTGTTIHIIFPANPLKESL